MKLVYIAGRLNGQNIEQNIAAARKVAVKWWQTEIFAVFCPHLNSGDMIGEAPEQVFFDGNMEILSRCDMIVMMKGYETSKGSVKELDRAYELGINVVFE